MDVAADAPDSGQSDYQVNASRFADLYDRYGDRVFRLSLRLCGGCHAEAEDVAQDALIAAFRSLPRFRGQAHLTTWLYTITVRTWRKRRAQREPDAFPLREGETHLSPDNTDAINTQLTRLSIERALQELPEPLREAFVLVKAEGLTHREAAAVLGIPQGTVQARVHEASRRLRTLLHDDEAL